MRQKPYTKSSDKSTTNEAEAVRLKLESAKSKREAEYARRGVTRSETNARKDGAKLRDKHARAMEVIARARDAPPPAPPTPAELAAQQKTDSINELSGLYTQATIDYQGKEFAAGYQPPRKVLSADGERKRAALWGPILQRCEESGVVPRRFIKANCDSYDREFNRLPEPFELKTEHAALTARDYKGKTEGRIVSGYIEYKMSDERRWYWNEKYISDTCELWEMSRVEYYRRFVLTRAHVVLDQRFMDADPAYRQAVSEQAPGEAEAIDKALRARGKRFAEAGARAERRTEDRISAREEADRKRKRELDAFFWDVVA